MIEKMGCADLHMHTNASDGKPTVRELLHHIQNHRRDLDVIAITDHDTLDASLWAYEQRHLYPFDIIPAVEVTSNDGHVLALWVTVPIPARMSLKETVIAIHEAGGIAILAHPCHPFMPEYAIQAWRYFLQPQVLLDAGIDGIEGYNAGIAGTTGNVLARQLAKRINLAITGGSDAHTLGAVGTGRTYFQGHNSDALKLALSRQMTTVKGTPWSINDYVGYIRHERQRKAMISSVTMNSPHLGQQSILLP